MKIRELLIRILLPIQFHVGDRSRKSKRNTSMAYALDKKMISVNPAEGVDLPKKKRKQSLEHVI